MLKKDIYPMRINKYLALRGISTRRGADEIIKAGQVKINGRKAVLGDKISLGDDVQVGNMQKMEEFVYLALNKPRGIITHSPQGEEKSIANIMDAGQKVFPVGRLDKDSSGLIILTNDGRITDRLLNPDYQHKKKYIVEVDRAMSPAFIERMGSGVTLDDGYTTRKCQVEKIDKLSFSIVLTEGKKRQIRRMCSKLDRKVIELRRVEIMNVQLGNLQPGKFRKIESQELAEFLAGIGLGK